MHMQEYTHTRAGHLSGLASRQLSKNAQTTEYSHRGGRRLRMAGGGAAPYWHRCDAQDTIGTVAHLDVRQRSNGRCHIPLTDAPRSGALDKDRGSLVSSASHCPAPDSTHQSHSASKRPPPSFYRRAAFVHGDTHGPRICLPAGRRCVDPLTPHRVLYRLRQLERRSLDPTAGRVGPGVDPHRMPRVGPSPKALCSCSCSSAAGERLPHLIPCCPHLVQSSAPVLCLSVCARGARPVSHEYTLYSFKFLGRARCCAVVACTAVVMYHTVT